VHGDVIAKDVAHQFKESEHLGHRHQREQQHKDSPEVISRTAFLYYLGLITMLNLARQGT
jgi:hypothetical protein